MVDALIEAKKGDVDVAIKLDKMQSAGKNQKIQIERLRSAGITAEVSRRSRLLHNKFMVVDGRRLWTGSYNWTAQAENRHRENVVIHESSELAKLFEEEWEMIEI